MKLIDGEMRQSLHDITELDMTPYNADDYLHHSRYHSFLKGCECEMRIIPNKRCDGYEDNAVNKYCKTHKVMCSKTGWEIGWFHGTKSEKPSPAFNRPLENDLVRKIKDDFKSGVGTLELCKRYNLGYYTIYGIISNSRYRDI
jgi:hypothetical protein